MKVLIAIYPFLNNIAEINGVEFVANPWGRDPFAEEIAEEMKLGKYDGLIVGTKNVSNSIMEHDPNLKVISRVGVGFNNIDVEYFKKHGVTTTYTPFGPTDSTAEMALALIMTGTRRLRNYDNEIRSGFWKREFGLRLKDAKVAIVGFGRIGKRLAMLLQPFGCEILLHDIAPDLATANAMKWQFINKEQVLQEADVISFHLPLKSDTRDWLSYNELAKLNRRVTVVNTARGGIVNEAAIYDYLKGNPGSYYCCDVFEQEPYTGKLIELENTMLTPHASSFTVGSRRQTELLAIDNCLKILFDQPCDNIVERNE